MALFLLAVPLVYGEAAEQQIVMEIEGMTCPLCALAIKKSLSRIDGVSDITVSYKKRKARLKAGKSVTDAMLVDAVKKAGPYTGRVIERTSKNR